MGRGVDLDFAIVGRAFSASFSCAASGCADWIALGFTPTAGRMIGATAVVKMPDADNSVQLLSLLGKSPSMVTPDVTSTALCVDAYWPLTTTERSSKAMSPSGNAHTHVVEGVTYWMPDGVSGAMHGEEGASCPESFCVGGYWPLTMTEAASQRMSPVGTAHTHVVNGITYYMPDQVVGDVHGENNGRCPGSIWNLRHTRMELVDGLRSLHFTVDLPPTIALDAVHLIFAGGVGPALSYHGTERGGMTLDLLNAHYRYNSFPPPAAPPQPSCGSASTLTIDSLEGFPCAVSLSPSMDLYYHLTPPPNNSTPATLRARLRCRLCRGWIALGFANTPGFMPGSKAVAALSQSVVAYDLTGRAPFMVNPLPASDQAHLSSTSVVRDATGVTMEFTVPAGQIGVPDDLGVLDEDTNMYPVTSLIYASGPLANDRGSALTYHGSTRGAIDVRLQPPTQTNVLLTSVAAGLTADEEGDSSSSSQVQGPSAGVLVLIACLCSFVLGALAVGVADRTRFWVKLSALRSGYGKAASKSVPEMLSASQVEVDLAEESRSERPPPPPEPPPF